MGAVLVLAGYLSGSVPFGVLLTRYFLGVDVRNQGSGNIGATNVARVAGKKLGVVVLVLDALKGALPVLAARVVRPEAHWLHVAVALAAVLGHVFPLWLRLKGGKGVATALGVALVVSPWAALAGASVYLLIFVFTRVSSLGSLFGGAAALGAALLTVAAPAYLWLLGGLFVLMLVTHRTNIRRLLGRSEARF